MALFSRGSKATGPQEDDSAPADVPAPDADGPAGEAPAAQVTISTTSYGGFGADTAAQPAPVAPTGEAPASTQTIPGLPDNVVLRGALAALGDDPAGPEILDVARQLFQGNVYLRIKGNAQELVDSGADLPLAIATRDDGQFVMVYSGGEALAAAVNADGDAETSAMGQAAPAVLQYVLQGDFAGIIIDHASAPASVVLPRALIERMFAEMDPALTLKRLVAGPRTAQTVGEVAQALATVPLWIAVNRASDDDDWGVAESRTETGERILPVFSHPLEVVALGRGDQPMPFEPAKLGAALRGDEGIDGIVVDPAGPWIRIDRADLGPVLALPEPEDSDADDSDADDDAGDDDAGDEDAEDDATD